MLLELTTAKKSVNRLPRDFYFHANQQKDLKLPYQINF